MTDEKKPRGALIRELAWLYMERVLILFCFAGLWWAAVRFGLADKFFVSTPLDVIHFLFANFWKEIVPNAVDTLRAMLIAFALSSVAGVLSGLALVELPRVKRLIDPFLTALNSMPRIALAPIFILWFGIGTTSKVVLAFSLGYFIVLMSTYAGMRNVDQTLMRLSRSLGSSPWQQFTKITLPWAIPSVFAGLKLALIYCFLGVVTSEMLASKFGLGQLIMYYSGLLQMEAVLAILLVMAVCAVALTMIADRIESALVGSWSEPLQSARS
jgi:ABC-type nitrate/sulfonate/bicarbonate transport system permease component